MVQQEQLVRLIRIFINILLELAMLLGQVSPPQSGGGTIGFIVASRNCYKVYINRF